MDGKITKVLLDSHFPGCFVGRHDQKSLASQKALEQVHFYRGILVDSLFLRSSTHLRLPCRPIGMNDGKCENSAQDRQVLQGHAGLLVSSRQLKRTGMCRWNVADDHGWLCTWDNFDWQTGCCKKGQQFACDRLSVAIAAALRYRAQQDCHEVCSRLQVQA